MTGDGFEARRVLAVHAVSDLLAESRAAAVERRTVDCEGTDKLIGADARWEGAEAWCPVCEHMTRVWITPTGHTKYARHSVLLPVEVAETVDPFIGYDRTDAYPDLGAAISGFYCPEMGEGA